jgi:hypothetical protein
VNKVISTEVAQKAGLFKLRSDSLSGLFLLHGVNDFNTL